MQAGARRSIHTGLVLVGFSLLLLGCPVDDPITEIVIVVQDELGPGTPHGAITLTVAHPNGAVQSESTRLDGSVRLPLTLGLRYLEGPLTPVTVTASAAILDGREVADRAVVSFANGQSLLLTLRLTEGCVDVDCRGETTTCVDGRCGPSARSELPMFTGVVPGADAGIDSGIDAGTDADAMDAVAADVLDDEGTVDFDADASECASDEECGFASRCRDRTCQPEDSCAQDWECFAGDFCDGSLCRRDVRGALPDGSRCDFPSDCSGGRCVQDGGLRRCTRACQSHADCEGRCALAPEGVVCDNGPPICPREFFDLYESCPIGSHCRESGDCMSTGGECRANALPSPGLAVCHASAPDCSPRGLLLSGTDGTRVCIFGRCDSDGDCPEADSCGNVLGDERYCFTRL